MPLVIRTSLYLAKVLDSWIGLDLASGRYLLFQGMIGEQIDRFTAQQATTADVESLHERGILEPDQGQQRLFAPSICSPADQLHQDTTIRPSLGLTMKAVWNQTSAKRQLARLTLCDALERLNLEMSEVRFAEADQCRDLVHAFNWSKRFVSHQDQCLVRGVAMCRMLAQRGGRTHLVIGVALPFIAHCWVQAGEIVLSDTIDRVRTYVPILAV
ncbi:transglutaminase superfamily protein [Hephaestia caeni]|uniref:Transglutaminase superfamily protein n=2 Tax=Hephaestia caeni TaxID=645617 RepID=A0A397PED2_9SPHN|nr:transglutaminase superfamily protein [Hephaestia caeni]